MTEVLEKIPQTRQQKRKLGRDAKKGRINQQYSYTTRESIATFKDLRGNFNWLPSKEGQTIKQWWIDRIYQQRNSKTLTKANEDLKPHAPRMVEIIIDKSFIGAVIGPGGKVIQEMQASTGTVINIEEVDDKGVVSIASTDAVGLQSAKEQIEKITFVPSVGDEYDATVDSIMPYGAFVKFGSKSGLLHVSEISWDRVENVGDVLSEGQSIKVKIIGIDERSGKMRLSRKVLMPKPERD
jgi:polyribonucleotide nucleotidyltransferase